MMSVTLTRGPAPPAAERPDPATHNLEHHPQTREICRKGFLAVTIPNRVGRTTSFCNQRVPTLRNGTALPGTPAFRRTRSKQSGSLCWEASLARPAKGYTDARSNALV